MLFQVSWLTPNNGKWPGDKDNAADVPPGPWEKNAPKGAAEALGPIGKDYVAEQVLALRCCGGASGLAAAHCVPKRGRSPTYAT